MRTDTHVVNTLACHDASHADRQHAHVDFAAAAAAELNAIWMRDERHVGDG
jgi:hypothetical protein